MTSPWFSVITALVIVSSTPTTYGENTYVALVPSYIRQGTTLRVPIRFLSTPGTQMVTVKLFDNDNNTISSTTDTADGLTSITPELEVPGNVTRGQYRVEVEGTGSITFKNSTYVWANTKAMSIFIQTDKALYKPGDTVKYRIFVVNSKLDLLEPTLNVEIKDPKGNKIDERTSVSDRFGISGELALSDMPPLGEWSISAEAPDFVNSKTSYNFGVEEYVLPKFEVTVELPPFATKEMPSLTGSVKAAYTFGKPVIGNLRLTISRRYSQGFFDAKAIVKEIPINGNVSFDIATVALEKLSRNLEYETLLVHANVTETITGITLDGQSDIRYYEKPYKVEFFPNLPSYFKTSFNPYEAMVKVTEQDDRPPVAPTGQLAVTVTYYTDRPIQGPVPNRVDVGDIDVISPFPLGDTIILDTVSYPLGDDGIVRFNLTIPESAATASIKAEYGGTKVYKNLRRFRSPMEVFLQANLINGGDLKIEDIAAIELLSSEGPVTVQYIVMSKGQVVYTGDINVNTPYDGQYIGTGEIAVTRDMSPSARFVAYFVRPDGEIVADGFNFIVQDIYENKVTVTMNQTEPVEPKTGVSIEVTAANDSLVHVLVVDRSVQLLRSGNDITPDRVSDELRRYGNSPWIPFGWGRHGFLPWPISADDSYDIFDMAQLEVLTDANLYRFDLWSLRQDTAFAARGGGFMMDAKSNGFAGAMGGEPVGHVRTYFPETWVWESGPVSNGRYIIPTSAPDTITTFVANAFALSPTKGLGVAPVASNLTVFLPFFVSIQLPYSVVRGETAVIQTNVFNYYPEQLNVLVKLAGSPDFVGITIDAQGQEVNVTGDLERCVTVPSNSPVPVFFSVRPLTVTNMKVQVIISAQNEQRNVFDDVTRYLRVKAEGTEVEKNNPLLLSFRTSNTASIPINISYPADVVPDSQHIRVTAIGDIFGPSLRNLDNLITMPYGCGEQNMMRFAPAVFAAAYLDQTNRTQSDSDLIQKIKDVLKVGYQRQLVYQRYNGSFSIFGDADDEGSLWLTSFVAKSLAQAHNYRLIYIDPEVVDRAVSYIISYQQHDGSFVNTGKVHHKAMQGGTDTNLRSLTAYILIALQEVKMSEIIEDIDTIRKLENAVLAASSYLIREIPQMTRDYEMAIGAYALKVVDSPTYLTLLTSLEASGNKTVEGNEKHWSNPPRALEVEIAAYALLTYASTEDLVEGPLILNWLIKQRNGNGGFLSTQDTVVALQALSEFAALVYTDQVNMTLDFYTTKNGVDVEKQNLSLTSDNHDLLQYLDFDGDVDQLTATVSGVGLVMIDVNRKYNIYNESDEPSYSLNVNVTGDIPSKHTLEVCAGYNVPNSRSNMAILDIGFVSGFEPIINDVDHFLIKRKEMSGNRLIIYFDEIPPVPICISVPVQRVSLVAGLKPANVLAYSYYEISERAMVEYLPDILRTQELCEICGAECGCPVPSGSTPEQSLDQCYPSGTR